MEIFFFKKKIKKRGGKEMRAGGVEGGGGVGGGGGGGHLRTPRVFRSTKSKFMNKIEPQYIWVTCFVSKI